MSTGRTRRTLAVAVATAPEVTLDYVPWAEFVRGAVSGKKLHDYYLGKRNPGVPLSPNEFYELVINLLADAIDTGAVTLPSPYKLEDFCFTVKQVGFLLDVEISLISRPALMEAATHAWDCLGRNRRLSNQDVAVALFHLCKGMSSIVTEDKTGVKPNGFSVK